VAAKKPYGDGDGKRRRERDAMASNPSSHLVLTLKEQNHRLGDERPRFDPSPNRCAPAFLSSRTMALMDIMPEFRARSYARSAGGSATAAGLSWPLGRLSSFFAAGGDWR